MAEATVPAPIEDSARQRIPAGIVRARPLHEEVLDRLRDMIVEGSVNPGERLHEIDLSLRLNVSRTPLREALKVLAKEGLVDLLPGRGARVSKLSAQVFGELFEVVSALERLAAELAVVRMTQRDLARLQRMHDKMAEHFAAGERHEYFALNHQIHLAIVAAAKNESLVAAHAALMVKARRGRYTALASEDRWKEAMAEHNALMEAFDQRDAAKAGQILFQHDQRTGETTKRMLEASDAR